MDGSDYLSNLRYISRGSIGVHRNGQLALQKLSPSAAEGTQQRARSGTPRENLSGGPRKPERERGALTKTEGHTAGHRPYGPLS